jgi:FtsZ-binding cell division protein ZapB
VFKQLFEFVRQAVFLQRDVRDLKENVASLERELHETTEALRRVAFELERVAERERHEREKFVLKIENALLRSDRLSPPAKEPKKQK